jgi:3-oxoadipate enol-lactonase
MTPAAAQGGAGKGPAKKAGPTPRMPDGKPNLGNGTGVWFPRAIHDISGTGGDLRNSPNVFDGPFPKHFETLAYDQRGLGRSAKPDRPYTMADYADDAAALLAALAWQDALIVGVSFGGMVAQEFAVTSPGRVERLALACTSAGGEGGSSYPLQKLLEFPREQRVAVELKLADSRWDQRWLEAHPVDRAIAERMAAAGQDQQDAAAVAAHSAQLQAREGHDVWDRLGAITCPTLVGYGNYDGIAPVHNGTSIASRIRGAELHGYEGGHGFLFQDPAALPAFVAFLQAPSS